MPTDVKPAAEIAAKWARITAQRGGDYESGAVGAGAKQNANAIAAVKSLQAAVSSPNFATLYTGGLKKAGADKYNRKVKDVGVSRFGQGVSAAQGDMASGMAPMVEAIASVTPPARFPRGDANNRARSEIYQTVLNKKRLALRAAGG